jgi:pimeloyl-ACP methyl ester carboxylesterase
MAMTLTEAWRARGEIREVFGQQVFCVVAGPEGGEPLLLLHGFPSSSLDFHGALPMLSARYRVIAPDHLGFGFSAKPAVYSYSLLEQAEVTIALLRGLGVSRAHVLAHDYGTSLATELLARRERVGLPFEIASLTLCNGSVHLDLAHLTPSQQLLRSRVLGPIFARIANRKVFAAQLRRILGDPASVPEAEIEAMWEGIEREQGRSRLPALASYMDERIRFRERWIGALRRLDVPAHVLWARRDPVAVMAIAEALVAEIPGARSTFLDGLGHYPMIEAPERWALAARAFLDEVCAAR